MSRKRKTIKKGQREGKAIKPRRDVDLAYRKDLFKIVDTLQDKALALASRIEKGGITEDDARDELKELSAEIDRQRADRAASKFVRHGEQVHTNQLNHMFRQSFGIDVLSLINDIPSAGLLNRKTVENINLITKMQKNQLAGIRSAVFANFRGDEFPFGRSLIEQIIHIGNVSDSRARLIARDQTNKLNGTLNQVRQTGLGIKEYRWMTSRDERVVGTPGGLYPRGTRRHNDHFERHRVIFRWDSPPPDGHPGIPIQDRCRANPIIDVKQIANLKKQQRGRKAA